MKTLFAILACICFTAACGGRVVSSGSVDQDAPDGGEAWVVAIDIECFAASAVCKEWCQCFDGPDAEKMIAACQQDCHDDGEELVNNNEPHPAPVQGTGGALATEPDAGAAPVSSGGSTTVEGKGDGGVENVSPQEDVDAGLDGTSSTVNGDSEEIVEAEKLQITFLGPSEATIYGGRQDAVMFEFSLEAGVDSLEVQLPSITLECDGGMLRGSSGTDYFSDIKVKDLETGVVVVGPVSLPASPSTPMTQWSQALLDIFVLRAGERREFAITADIASSEDVLGELFGKSCRFTIGALADHWVQVSYETNAPATGPYLTANEMNLHEDILGEWVEMERYPACVGCPIGPQPDPCRQPYAVFGADQRMYYVAARLAFSLDPSSPSGAIGDGLQEVITINAKATCGDVVLTRILFQTLKEEVDGNVPLWMSSVNENRSISGISYDYEGVYVFEGYGEGHESSPEFDGTALYWNHQFTQPIVIKKGETFTFSLSLVFGDQIAPDQTLRFQLSPRYSWYGVYDPEAFPDVLVNSVATTVLGNELIYAP